MNPKQNNKRNKQAWPSITASQGAKSIIDEIKKSKGFLGGMESKDILLIAASLAIKKGLPPIEPEKGKRSDVVSYANLSSTKKIYQEYKQYLSVIYFETKGKREIQNMRNTADIVANFEDYSERGLQYLNTHYLAEKNGPDELLKEFISLVVQLKNMPENEQAE